MRLLPDDPAVDSNLSTEPAAQRRRHAVLRKRLLWTGLVLLFAALMVVLPPLINANRYRNQIAQTMSASLGRPVHLDAVSLHLLPVPGFTLQNFVVSEDPNFGAEPTVRADSVEATLRVSSLWRRPVEFSNVRFVSPSVNLVRNGEGRWNLSEVLLHASRVESAPTDQRRAGPTPRFPYIEATGGRVNVKLGAEKLPFSLIDADFALWLPSPRQWSVRLVGHPARTDTNITDPGTFRLEGGFRRVPGTDAVPINFLGSWHDAPLGEASRIVTGDDRGWRGALNVDMALNGTLGDARLASKLTVGGLRRSEFFPTHPLDLQITCKSGFVLHPVALTGLACSLPDDAPEPLMLTADRVSLQPVQDIQASVQGKDIPVRWALLWAALYSSRVPTDLRPPGLVDIDLNHGIQNLTPGPPPKRQRRGRNAVALPTAVKSSAVANSWNGTVRLTVTQSNEGAAGETPAKTENILLWTLEPTPTSGDMPQLHLDPTPVRLGSGATVTLGGTVNSSGYSLSVTGSASAAALLVPARYLPQLGDGMEQVLPYPPTSPDPGRVEFTCKRQWPATQTCVGLRGAQPRGPVLNAPTVQAQQTPQTLRTPPALAPHSLSPLDYPPPGTPR